MKKVIITGGCGFIGSNIAVSLRADNYDVVCLDNLSRPGSEFLRKRILKCGCKFIQGDIRFKADIERYGCDYDLMIDCSANPTVLAGMDGEEAFSVIDNNLIGSVNCFEFCRKRKVPIIFLSTSRVYPYDRINKLAFKQQKERLSFPRRGSGITLKGVTEEFPLSGYRSLYGATKLCSEFILREYSINFGIPSLVNRCGVIAGPWQLGKVDQGVFTHWMVCHVFRKKLNYIGCGGTGRQVRDLLHIDDLIVLIKKQMKVINNFRGNIFNVGGGVYSNLSLLEATKLCQRISGIKLLIGRIKQDRPVDIKWYISDSSVAEKLFSWKPLAGPEKILADVYNWLMANKELSRNLFVK